MTAFSKLLVGLAHARSVQRAHRARDPRPSQERTLRRLTARAARTAFGRRHDFEGIHDVKTFRERLPVLRYADLEPWLTRALGGEPDVVWPGLMPFFAWSSGTTAGKKYLPISWDQIRQQRLGAFDPMATYLCATNDDGLMDGKAIFLGGKSELELRPGGVRVGVNTGIMQSQVPPLLRKRHLPGERARAIGDWDEKMAALARESIDADVRFLAGCPSWFPGLFERVLDEARARGRRAETIFDVWPRFRMMTGGGIAYEPYRPILERYVGQRARYVDLYNATEGGIMGVQDDPGDPAMLLIPDNDVYYELVPVEELSAPSPKRFSLWEAEPNVVYALLVTTSSGIFSYAIGDCLRFTSTFPHRFVFEGRVGGWLNVVGELVSQAEVERAIGRAAAASGITLADFTVGADLGIDGAGAARHVLLLECAAAASEPALARFARVFDDDLFTKNGDYAAHRACRASLHAPVAVPLRRGAFHDWMKSRGKLGAQNKVPRILLDRPLRSSLEAHSLVAN
jgi:hypothetical protein